MGDKAGIYNMDMQQNLEWTPGMDSHISTEDTGVDYSGTEKALHYLALI